MSEQIENLINIIKKSDSTIDICTEQIQETILSDKSLATIYNKIKNKLIGIEKDNFNIILRTKSDYSFILEISSTSENELQIIYFRINQDLEITDYNYKYEFEDMNKFSNELLDVMKRYFK